jgi:hypothetical protein
MQLVPSFTLSPLSHTLASLLSHCEARAFACLAGNGIDALVVRASCRHKTRLFPVVILLFQVPNNETLTDWSGYGCSLAPSPCIALFLNTLPLNMLSLSTRCLQEQQF